MKSKTINSIKFYKTQVLKIYPDALLLFKTTILEHNKKPLLVLVPAYMIYFERSKTEIGAWRNAYNKIYDNSVVS